MLLYMITSGLFGVPFHKQGTLPRLLSSPNALHSEPFLLLRIVMMHFHHTHDLSESGDIQDCNSGR